MNHGLPERVVGQIQGVLGRYPAVEQAILYGSRAKGTFRTGSDIDLTLVGEGLDWAALGRIEQELDDLLLPWEVDLSLFESLSHPELIDHIRRVGRVMYARKGAALPACGEVDTRY